MTKKFTIKSWSSDDQPREKLIKKGRESLSNAELVAILLGSGSPQQSAVTLSQKILKDVDNRLSILSKWSFNDLLKYNGIGKAKAVTIVAAMELGRRRLHESPEVKTKITCSKDIYNYLQPLLMDLDHEQFWIIMLNRANEVIESQKVSIGGRAATIVDPKIIFKKALDKKATSIIVSHNHPSGQLKPSSVDLQITKKLREAGQILDIPLLDHIIFSDNGYYSFADEGVV